MINQIDKTYFWGNIKIAGTFDEEKNDLLNQYIAKHQYNYFVSMFGKTIADNMPAELLALLKNTTLKTSPIANYVYFFFQKDQEVLQTNTGNKVLDIQNTTNMSPYTKMVDAWNEMVVFNVDLQNKLFDDVTLVVAAIPEVPEVPEVIDPPTPAIPAVPAIEGYTITYLTDIYENIDTENDIFHKRNIFGL